VGDHCWDRGSKIDSNSYDTEIDHIYLMVDKLALEESDEDMCDKIVADSSRSSWVDDSNKEINLLDLYSLWKAYQQAIITNIQFIYAYKYLKKEI